MAKRNHCAVLVLSLSLSVPLLFSQNQGDTRLSKAAVAAADARTQVIKEEIRSLRGHEWAGEYYFGDGLGVNVSLAIAPNNGFSYTWTGCLGLYDLNYGTVSFTNGALKLIFKYPNSQEHLPRLAAELIPVRWGNRHYLLDVKRMVEFTNAVNAGTEPSTLFGGRSGSFLLRRGDEKKAAKGRPTLPKEFLGYLLPAPLNAKVLSVDKTGIQNNQRVTHIRIDVGSASGLKKGMELFVHSPSKVYDSAIVTEVEENWASAVILQDNLDDPAPSDDWELSTKL